MMWGQMVENDGGMRARLRRLGRLTLLHILSTSSPSAFSMSSKSESAKARWRKVKVREATVLGDREWCDLHLQDSATTSSTRYK